MFEKNAKIASVIGRLAGKNDISLVAGNVTSTFGYAFEAAKEYSVSCICVMEKHKKKGSTNTASEFYYTADTYSKHAQIAEMADAAILIGGGSGSQMLLNHFIKLKKTVIAIEGSGGIADKKLPAVIKKEKNPTKAFQSLFSIKKEKYLSSPLGMVKLSYDHFALTKLEFIDEKPGDKVDKKKDAFVRDLKTYFKGKPTEFTGKIHSKGTKFQKEVWQTLLDIPYGSVMDFTEFAGIMNMKNTEGVTAKACFQNPIQIIIPNHRLMTKRGGFHGDKEIQMRLLDLEKRQTELSVF